MKNKPSETHIIRLWVLLIIMVVFGTSCSNNMPANSAKSGALIKTIGSDLPGTFESYNLKDVALSDYLGKAVVLIFGYTQCPDICPTTMQHWQDVFSLLPTEEAEKTQLIFVTVDPDRDSAEFLASYMAFFDPRFIGLHSDQETLNELLSELHTFARKVPSRTPGQYSMDHSGSAYLIGFQGVLLDELPFGTDVRSSVDRLREIISSS